jgi:hypothetical protein
MERPSVITRVIRAEGRRFNGQKTGGTLGQCPWNHIMKKGTTTNRRTDVELVVFRSMGSTPPAASYGSCVFVSCRCNGQLAIPFVHNLAFGIAPTTQHLVELVARIARVDAAA